MKKNQKKCLHDNCGLKSELEIMEIVYACAANRALFLESYFIIKKTKDKLSFKNISDNKIKNVRDYFKKK